MRSTRTDSPTSRTRWAARRPSSAGRSWPQSRFEPARCSIPRELPPAAALIQASPVIEPDEKAIEDRYGPEVARRLWDLGQDSVALVRALIDRHGIDALWRPGVAWAAVAVVLVAVSVLPQVLNKNTDAAGAASAAADASAEPAQPRAAATSSNSQSASVAMSTSALAQMPHA